MNDDIKQRLDEYIVEIIGTVVLELVDTGYTESEAIKTVVSEYLYMLNNVDFAKQKTFRAVMDSKLYNRY